MILTYTEIREALPEQGLDIIQRLGSEPSSARALVCDGREGPKTRSALYLDPRPILALCAHGLGKVALGELLAGAAEVAPHPGAAANNRGAWVNKYCRMTARASTSVDRGAWCAFFSSWALDAWARTQGATFQKVGGARRLVRDELKVKVPLGEVRPGDLVAWESKTRPSPYGHVGIVVAREGSRIATVEGNADLTPGLDGVTSRLFGPDLVRIDGARPLYAARLVL